jgi:PAS domain S-box-containing protein
MKVSNPSSTAQPNAAAQAMPVRPVSRASVLQTPLKVLAIALAYAVLAVIGRMVALGPGDASPVWPAAGMAFAAVLICGRRYWPGVWAGAFASFPDFEANPAWLLLAAGVATGATLQAVVGAALVRPLFERPMPLAAEADLFRFLFFAGPAACLISATIGTLALHLAQDLEAHASLGYWLVWWVGDVLGVVLFAPVFLIILSPTGMPFWQGQGTRIITPLIITALLLAAGNMILDRFEETQKRLEVEKLMDEAHEAHFAPLHESVTVMHSAQRLFAQRSELSRRGFLADALHLMQNPGVIAVEWVERVRADDVDRFEAAVRGETGEPFMVFERQGGSSKPAKAPDEYFVIRYSEPRALNGRMVGLTVNLREELHSAFDRATETGLAAATEPVILYRTGRLGAFVIVPIYERSLEPRLASPDRRREAVKGFVRGVVDFDEAFFKLAREASRQGLLHRISDVSEEAAPILIETSMSPDAAASWKREINFGGRVWRLEMQSATPYWHPGASLNTRLFLALSVLTAFAAAFSSLGSAGRAAATEAEVVERTTALQRELAARSAAEHALRKNERDLSITLASIGDAVIATDAELRVQRMNAVAERLTAWPLEKAAGCPIDDVFCLIDPQSGEPVECPVRDVMSTHRPYRTSNNVFLRSADGRECPVSHSAAPILATSGEFFGVVLIFRDTTEERAAREALEESEKRYRQFMEFSPYGVFVQGDGRFAFVNRKAIEIFGASSEHELLGRPVLDFIHPDDRTFVATRIRDLNTQRRVAPAVDLRWLRIGGDTFHGESTAVPYEHEGLPGALVMLQDITLRKNAEEERDRFFELVIDLLCVIAGDGYFIRINSAFTQVLGWSKEELLSRPSMDFVHPDDLDDSLRALGRLNEGVTVHAFENRFRCKNGQWRRLSWNALPQPDGKIFASAHDVTEQYETSRQLKELNAELETSLAERTAAVEEAKLASRVKSAFLATMSHEIRTPMNGILGMAEMLHNSQLTADQLEQVTTLQESANALLRIIDDILDFSKIEAGRLELEKTPVSLTDLAEGLCSSLSQVSIKRNVDLLCFVSPRIPEHVVTDDVRLRQLLYNLLGNAIKFSSGQSSRGRVSLRVEPLDDDPAHVRFEISDNGIGIAPDALEHLFTPFSQAEVSTTRRFGGTGLGLAICKRLTELMGGDIEVTSAVGKGSTFTITLPLAPAPVQPVRILPDLSGVHCVTVAGALLNGHDLREYLESAGAQVWHADTIGAAARLAKAREGPIVVLRDIGNAKSGMHAALKDIGNVRQVLITRGRRSRARQILDDAVLLDGASLRRAALLRAVAVAAGRASPEMFIDPATRELIGTDSPAPSIEEARARGQLILVAEDDDINRKVISQQLSLLGYAFEIAADGLEALALWRTGGHALLITDMHMPNMDGYTLAKTIRAHEAGGSRLPILALTANAIRGEAARAHASGIDAYLTKPIQLSTLKQELENWLPKNAADASGPQASCTPETTDAPGVLDLSALEAVVGDDVATRRHFLQSYLASAEALALELKEAVSEMDFEAIVRIAHRLKSSSRSMGAMSLGSVCAALEDAAARRDPSRVRTDWQHFDDNLINVRSAIQQHLSSA